MIISDEVLDAWATQRFRDLFSELVCGLEIDVLPLQQGLTQSSVALFDNIGVNFLSEQEDGENIRVKIGLSYSGVDAGCSCDDDPTPLAELPEYCEVLCVIHKTTKEATFQLLND